MYPSWNPAPDLGVSLGTAFGVALSVEQTDGQTDARRRIKAHCAWAQVGSKRGEFGFYMYLSWNPAPDLGVSLGTDFGVALLFDSDPDL